MSGSSRGFMSGDDRGVTWVTGSLSPAVRHVWIYGADTTIGVPGERAAANPGRFGGEGGVMTLVCPASGPGYRDRAAAPRLAGIRTAGKRQAVRPPPAG